MIGPQGSLASTRELPDSKPRVTYTDGGVRVSWQAAAPLVQSDSEGKTRISIPGFETLDMPGVARLPYASLLVALPPDSNPELRMVSADQQDFNFEASLQIGDQPAGVRLDGAGNIIGGDFVEAELQARLVDQAVALEPIGVVRGVHLARLTFYPLIQDGSGLRLTTSLEVEVDFGPVLQSSRSTATADNPVHDLVRAAVINPKQVQVTNKVHGTPSRGQELQAAENGTIAVEVSSRGITDITYTSLVSAGTVSGPVNLNSISLSRDGTGIAYDVVGGDEDTSFEPGEALRFFADPRFSRWSNTDSYILNLDGSPGISMDSRNANPDGKSPGTASAEVTFEDNKIYTPGCYCAPIPPGRDGDRWVGYQLQRPGAPSQDIPFELPGYDRTKAADLTLWLIGFTDVGANPDHKVNVAIKSNGSTVGIGSIQFNGKTSHEANLTINANSLPAGDYQLSLTIPSDTPGDPVDGVWLDAFSIRYDLDESIPAGEAIAINAPDPNNGYSIGLASSTGLQAFDITNPEQPKTLTGVAISSNQITIANDGQPHDYWVTTSTAIQTPDRLRSIRSLATTPGFAGADYVMIAPEQFIPSLDPLVALHQSNGLQVVVEDVQAIYDTVGDGRSGPAAIRDYLKDAYDTWDLSPLYVLLVGDGTHDPKNYLETSSGTFIPPFLEVVDPWAGETAADNRYVSIDGSDDLPDMLIGRLPANSISELNTIVSKIVGYAGKAVPEPWQHQAVFVADDNDFGGGNFPLLSDTLINKIPANTLAAQRLYYSSEFTPTQFRSLVNQVWDDGNGLIMFTGHSSIHQWAHEILFHLEDVPDLANDGRLPVVLEMTCFTGSYQIHDFPTLDEDLLRKPGGGAVAVWGATGLGIATGHHWLAEGFMETIYQDGISEIGAAALAGKLNLATVGSHPDLIDTFTLLGDPATRLERSYQIYVPITKN